MLCQGNKAFLSACPFVGFKSESRWSELSCATPQARFVKSQALDFHVGNTKPFREFYQSKALLFAQAP
jgi:hypothetical protein